MFHQELRVLTKAGEPRWVDLTSSMVRDGDGNPLYRLSQVQGRSTQERRAGA